MSTMFAETTSSFLKRKLRYAVRMFLQPPIILADDIRLNVSHPVISPKMRRVIYNANYERPESAIVKQLIQPQDRVLDLGAGLGFVAALCSKLVNDATQVLTVEANPSLLPAIQDLFQRNSISPQLRWGAVTRSEKVVKLGLGNEFVSSSLRQRQGLSECIEVPGLPINELIQEHAPTVIVMDIEGAEIECLKAADLSGVRAICVELHQRIVGRGQLNDLVDDLRSKGFEQDFESCGMGTFLFLKPDGNP